MSIVLGDWKCNRLRKTHFRAIHGTARRTGGGLWWMQQWSFGFHKIRRISWPTVDLL